MIRQTAKLKPPPNIPCNTIRYTDATGLSIAVVVSPLTSLTLDQPKFAPRGLKVDFVGEHQSDPLAKQNVLQGNVQLVYITPENLNTVQGRI